MASAISVVVERRSVVESRHRVHAVLVRSGDVAAAAGDPGLEAFMRSAAKPFQALPLAAAAPDLRTEEIAIAAASHEAQPQQLDAVRSVVAAAAELVEPEIETGVDGCGVVAYALPLVAMARMFERLAGGELVGADR